ncbi:MAG TPA: sugar phosphate isomerase/epimerase [Terriglobia bacterium]|nr:sugar phosphate isomerase/epimerase [Terriglobia bacterium]
MTTRRDFLGTAGASLLGLMASVKTRGIFAKGAPSSFKGPYGLELYSLRNQIKRGDASTVEAALSYAKQVGYTEIEVPELYGLTAADFRKRLDQAGLPCTSLMTTYDECQNHLEDVIQNAHTLGAGNIINVWIPHNGPFTLSVCQQAIADYNTWGEKVHAAGLRFGHHTHGYEFQPYHGRPLFDMLIDQTHPSSVEYEMDIFWVVDAGESPVAYLQRYPNRFRLLHLKDMRKGPPVKNYTGGAPLSWDVPLGTGRIDLKGILREALKIGVKQFYVEDESNNSRQNIIQSLHFLKTVKL